MNYPLDMQHPGYRPAQISYAHGQGQPALYPPVTVYSKDQEDQYRAKGYLAPGERQKPMVKFEQYPMMMVHPDAVAEVPAQVTAQMVDGRLVQHTMPAVPGRFPPVTAMDESDKRMYESQGYRAPKANPAAFVAMKSSPKASNGYKPSDYPMWVNGQIVNSREEHVALIGGTPEEAAEVEALETAPGGSAALAQALAEIERLKAQIGKPQKAKNKGGRPKGSGKKPVAAGTMVATEGAENGVQG